MDKVKVLIAIQARSTSKRLPGKSLEQIDNLSMVETVWNTCKSTCDHINRYTYKSGTFCEMALLIPYGDPIKNSFSKNCIIEGDEDDVLGRYTLAVGEFEPNYIVRITGDCPLVAPPVINKHIQAAIHDSLDYCSNVFEDCRTFVDGYDVEVISRNLMDWLEVKVEKDFDREHVTTYFRENPPRWAKIGSVMGHIDMSDTKLSVDTKEDLEMVRENKRALNEKLSNARKLGHAIYRF